MLILGLSANHPLMSKVQQLPCIIFELLPSFQARLAYINCKCLDIIPLFPTCVHCKAIYSSVSFTRPASQQNGSIDCAGSLTRGRRRGPSAGAGLRCATSNGGAGCCDAVQARCGARAHPQGRLLPWLRGLRRGRLVSRRRLAQWWR
jgi:hypothetical protein